MSMRASVSAATSGSEVWKITRAPSAEAPRNWLLSAPLPPVGPVETKSVVLWFPHAAAHARSQQSAVPASAPVFALFICPPKQRRQQPPLLTPKSGNYGHEPHFSC